MTIAINCLSYLQVLNAKIQAKEISIKSIELGAKMFISCIFLSDQWLTRDEALSAMIKLGSDLESFKVMELNSMEEVLHDQSSNHLQ